MTRDSDYRRQMGMDMPVPARDMSTERYSIKHTSNVEPEKPKAPHYMIVGGVILVEEDGGWRNATLEEIERLMGEVASWPDREDGEL